MAKHEPVHDCGRGRRRRHKRIRAIKVGHCRIGHAHAAPPSLKATQTQEEEGIALITAN